MSDKKTADLLKRASSSLCQQKKTGDLSEAGLGRRRSQRLSGVKPDLSLDEAKKVFDSPRGTTRSRRSSGASDSGSVTTSATTAAASILSVKKRLLEVETIAEEGEEVKVIDEEVAERLNKRETKTLQVTSKSANVPNVESNGKEVKEINSEPTQASSTRLKEKPNKEVGENEDKEDLSQTGETKEISQEISSLIKAPVLKNHRIPSTSSNIPKGKCKSGRFWKSERDRFRSVIKSNKGLIQKHEQRQKVKEEKRRAKELQESIREEKKRKLEDLKQRREENKKRREANALKSEVVQTVSLVIIDPSQIFQFCYKFVHMVSDQESCQDQENEEETAPDVGQERHDCGSEIVIMYASMSIHNGMLTVNRLPKPRLLFRACMRYYCSAVKVSLMVLRLLLLLVKLLLLLSKHFRRIRPLGEQGKIWRREHREPLCY